MDIERDALALFEGAQDLARRVPFPAVDPDKADFMNTVSRILTLPQLEVLVAETDTLVGAIGIMYVPSLWEPSVITAEHLFLWAHRDAPFRTAYKLIEAAISKSDERKACPVFHAPARHPTLRKAFVRFGLECIDETYARIE